MINFQDKHGQNDVLFFLQTSTIHVYYVERENHENISPPDFHVFADELFLFVCSFDII